MKTSRAAFVGTSALAKAYLQESGSAAVERHLSEYEFIAISRLHVLESRSLLNRRRRAREIAAEYATNVWRAFQAHISEGILEVVPLEDRHAIQALDLLDSFRDVGLKTLDAMHLAVVLDHKDRTLVTADRVMADIGNKLGIQVRRF